MSCGLSLPGKRLNVKQTDANYQYCRPVDGDRIGGKSHGELARRSGFEK